MQPCRLEGNVKPPAQSAGDQSLNQLEPVAALPRLADRETARFTPVDFQLRRTRLADLPLGASHLAVVDRQSSVFGRIGRKLMQDDGKVDDLAGRQGDGGAGQTIRCSLGREGGKRGLDDDAQVCRGPRASCQNMLGACLRLQMRKLSLSSATVSARSAVRRNSDATTVRLLLTRWSSSRIRSCWCWSIPQRTARRVLRATRH